MAWRFHFRNRAVRPSVLLVHSWTPLPRRGPLNSKRLGWSATPAIVCSLASRLRDLPVRSPYLTSAALSSSEMATAAVPSAAIAPGLLQRSRGLWTMAPWARHASRGPCRSLLPRDVSAMPGAFRPVGGTSLSRGQPMSAMITTNAHASSSKGVWEVVLGNAGGAYHPVHRCDHPASRFGLQATPSARPGRESPVFCPDVSAPSARTAPARPVSGPLAPGQ